MGKLQTTEHWDKLVALIVEARDSAELRRTLQTHPPHEVTAALQQRDISMDDLGAIFTDLELISDRNSGRFWSPLA